MEEGGRRRLPVVAEVLEPRSNAIGLLRLTFALLVVVDHSWPLALGEEPLLGRVTHGQVNLGALAVAGFFVLSGLLVTRSARRSSLGRFAWHRALRILPAFWVCLLLTALVVAPALWWADRGSVAGYPGADPSPLGYLTRNWFTAMDQYGIGDLLTRTPYGVMTGDGVFDGALWTLRYEILCYLGAAVFAAWALLRRRPLLVLVPAAAALAVAAAADLVAGGDRFGRDPSVLPALPALPLLGGFSTRQVVAFGLVFVLGAFAASVPDRFPVSRLVAVPAAALAAGTAAFGGWDLLGLPAFGYLVLFAAMRLPRRLHRVNTRTDVSYGVYIYGFLIQQVLATLNVQRLGVVPFAILACALSLVAGRLSWVLVERPALRLKDAQPPWRRRDHDDQDQDPNGTNGRARRALDLRDEPRVEVEKGSGSDQEPATAS